MCASFYFIFLSLLSGIAPSTFWTKTEAINLVGRSAELFLEYFARECHEVAVSFKKKTITPQHFDLTARRVEKLDFLRDTYRADDVVEVPEKKSIKPIKPKPGASAKVSETSLSGKKRNSADFDAAPNAHSPIPKAPKSAELAAVGEEALVPASAGGDIDVSESNEHAIPQ